MCLRVNDLGGQCEEIHSIALKSPSCLSELCVKRVFCLCPHSVLGTLAATYMTIAIVIKYHTTPSVLVHITPLYSSGYVCLRACECNLSAPLVAIDGEVKR